MHGAEYGGGGPGIVGSLVYLAIVVVMIAAMWRVFSKAGAPGWASIIPFYNAYVFLKIAGKPGWWLILFFIPIVNVIIGIIALVSFCNAFGKGLGFLLGLIFLPFIFYPILAWGDAEYEGSYA
ncbi:MAG: DUF5684 domain-containing protein [Thermodesulfobacteriota bacterium]